MCSSDDECPYSMQPLFCFQVCEWPNLKPPRRVSCPLICGVVVAGWDTQPLSSIPHSFIYHNFHIIQFCIGRGVGIKVTPFHLFNGNGKKGIAKAYVYFNFQIISNANEDAKRFSIKIKASYCTTNIAMHNITICYKY